MARNPTRSLLFLLTLTLALTCGSQALAQGACCTFDSCANTADEPACTGLNGVFLDGEDCVTDPCAPAACCDNTTCNIADAFSCVTAGRTYAGAGVTCLDDPCDAGIGACCLNGSCSDDSPEDCDLAGGTWLGAGTNCTQGLCDLGSCCQPGVCDDSALFECNAAGGGFVDGGDCVSDPEPCAVPDDCALNSLYSQSPDNPNFFMGYTSEASSGLKRYDDYSGTVGAIDRLKWWGFDLDLVGSEFVECVESNNTFEITFHEDLAGQPDATVCSYTLPVTRTPTGILYDVAELNEYSVDLPTDCVLINGWVSIVGQGDPECWFLWLSSKDGDGLSYCDNCQVEFETDDLAVCLGGDKGGVSGACCDQSTGGCTDGVAIDQCATTGQRFEVDTLCAALDPPCAPENGACCFDDASPCSQELPNACATAGGEWLGAGVDCSFCPELGACCFDQQSCSLETEADCNSVGFTYVGVGTTCDQCPATPECAGSSLFAQSPDDPSDFIAGSSESPVFQRFEDFSGVGGAIESLTWWGVDLDSVGGDNFVECVETIPDFQISFHEDGGGVPGPVVCSHTVTASYLPTGIMYLGTELNEYSATLPSSCVLTNGWVSIVGLGDPECWFLWMSSDLFGDSWCDNCVPSAQDFDLNACFGGTLGGVFGACCNESTQGCTDNTEISDCIGPDDRFAEDQTCGAIDPPCGTLRLEVEPDVISWTALLGGVRYDLVRGDLGQLISSSGDFTLATEECLGNNLLDNFLVYSVDPPSGEGFWFVVREVTVAGNGTYDSSGPSQSGSRNAEIDASPFGCP